MEAKAYRLPPLVPRISGTGCSYLPTPERWDANRGPDERDRPGSGGPNLLAAVKESDIPTGQLSPGFVEWLMGFPRSYTEI